MSPLCQTPEADELRQLLAEKDREYAKAMKEGREFSSVKKIFLEIKELRTKLMLLAKS